MLHKDLNQSQNHVVSTWVVADAAARLALTPLSGDVGKVCWQQSDDSLWILKNHSPAAWVELGSSVKPLYDFFNKGSVSGAVTLSLTDGNMQRVTCTAATTLSISNWPAAPKVG